MILDSGLLFWATLYMYSLRATTFSMFHFKEPEIRDLDIKRTPTNVEWTDFYWVFISFFCFECDQTGAYTTRQHAMTVEIDNTSLTIIDGIVHLPNTTNTVPTNKLPIPTLQLTSRTWQRWQSQDWLYMRCSDVTELSIKSHRHVGRIFAVNKKSKFKMRKSGNSCVTVNWLGWNSTHNSFQAFVSLHCCNTVYLQHGRGGKLS